MGFWKSSAKAVDKIYSTTMTVAEAVQDWIKNHPKEVQWFEKHDIKIDSDVLKDEKYRDVRFDAGMPPGQSSCKVFDGKFYYTVGEYNDAVEKAYGPGGKFFQG